MGRNLKPRGKISRRIGEKLQLKGDRDVSVKHAFTRRSYPPGIHGPKGYGRLTEYGIQLREKQKLKALFGLMERQFARAIAKALTYKGVTGAKLLELLERRLDNVVFRLHLASSRAHARQLVSHGFVAVNEKKVCIPSYEVRVGDRISFTPRFFSLQVTKDLLTVRKSINVEAPSWIEFDYQALTGRVIRAPGVDECEPGVDTRLIVEFYSR
ncbi:MAG: 30S ribosomal protein S4 [Patescibacteria group bacterium]